MKLKMPGPNGIITLASDPDIALRTEKNPQPWPLRHCLKPSWPKS